MRDEDQRPHILIDGSSITPKVDGLSVYVVNLLRNLPESSFEQYRFTLLLNPGVQRADLDEALAAHDFAVMTERIAPIGPQRDWHMFRFLRANRHRFDLIHIPSNNYPLTLRGGICTIHHVTLSRWMDRYAGIPGTALAANAYLRLVMRATLRKSRAIIAVSRATKAEIGRQMRASAEELGKIVVIHEGWEHLVSCSAADCEPFAFEGSPYLLFVGINRPHKNLTGLLSGFLVALDDLPPGVKLVICGSNQRLTSEQRRLLSRINAGGDRAIFTGYVSGDCVRRLYEQAHAFVLPSFAEGFGLPILESFLTGTPVLCSNRTA